ncbi:hypothetical protein JRI60_41675 [Archangium violaceum]|uniref:hypothetical protein n=1 Tax=Archangium violaceum TaxID=83451 RepID=UPI0019518215|nr:hypothetical protein [Archangium violaceum]QRN95510.1 hypothetical protein JRI60_41675 [Archangium violaceum]
MNKKVLVGVGIGCGSLVLLAVIGVGVGAWWLKRQVGDSMSSMMAAGQKMQAMGQELAQLERQHPFTAPAEGEVLALSEARVLDYLGVREAVLPAFAEFEKQSQGFQEEHQDSKQADFGAAMKATEMMTEQLTRVHGSYIEGLKKHRMSPSEYHAITQTLYASTLEGITEQEQEEAAAVREEALQQVREQLKDGTLDAEQRAALEEEERQLESMGEEAAQAPALSESAKVAVATNLNLLEKHRERIERAGNPGMDSVLLGTLAEAGTPAGAAQDTP